MHLDVSFGITLESGELFDRDGNMCLFNDDIHNLLVLDFAYFKYHVALCVTIPTPRLLDISF